MNLLSTSVAQPKTIPGQSARSYNFCKDGLGGSGISNHITSAVLTPLTSFK